MRVVCGWLMLVAGSVTAAEEFSPEDLEFFEKQVRPLLVEKCQQCHGAKTQKGGLRLDSRETVLRGGETGPALKPGDEKASLLVEAINYDPDGYQMPPTGKLSDEQIAVLTEWVRRKAPWPEMRTENAVPGPILDLEARARHWSFQPLHAGSPPAVTNSRWARNLVDPYLLAPLETAGLSPAQPADSAALLRRLNFELIGLPPTPEELDEFLQDAAPDAVDRVVDRLLASPHYGERWARHWLDLVRFAETYGHEFDYEIRFPQPYRDYVIRAWNGDVPYQQFVREHIAGDLLPEQRRDAATGQLESVIGTAFWWFGQGKHSPVDIRGEECDTVDNQLDVFGKTFLGMTVACARCHDHKFDPITQRDYYALVGYLQSSRQTYADINPPELTRRALDRLAQLHRNEERSLLDESLTRWEAFAARLPDLLMSRGNSPQELQEAFQKRLQDEARPDPRHPLHLWAHWSANAAQLANQKAALPGFLRQFADAEVRQRNLTGQLAAPGDAEAAESSDTRWFAEGFAFDLRPRPRLTWLTSSAAEQPLRGVVSPQTGIHSGVAAAEVQGTLRSPTFAVEKPYIDVLARRRGGAPGPIRGDYKSGQIHFVVDGFQIIKSPLWGHFSVNVAQREFPAWYRIDVTKFIGSKAYLEIDDPDDGEIVVEQILFQDQGLPPRPFNELMSRELSQPGIETLDDLAQVCGRVVQNLLKSVREEIQTGKTTIADQDLPAAADLLNWLLREESLMTPAAERKPTPQGERFAAQRRQIIQTIPPPQRTLAMTAGSAENEHVLIRGNHKKPGEEVPRRFLEVFRGEHAPETTRLDLADRMVDGVNPLAPRVFVNRLWQHLFGRGIVPTSDDFGKMGQPPTHPELLDRLAAELIRGDWSTKRMQRLLVTSQAFRMSSQREDAAAEQADPENKLWHRAQIQRLESEAIRDSLLLISGRLDDRMFGSSVMPHLTEFMEGRGRPGGSGPLDGHGRRSLYINVRRNFLTPLFLAFDFPTPFTTMGRRSTSNVPAQALTLMNNPFVLQQAELWVRPPSPAESPAERLRRLYQSAFSRAPSDAEIQAAEEFLQQQASEYGSPNDPRSWTDLAHVLLNVKEFVFVE